MKQKRRIYAAFGVLQTPIYYLLYWSAIVIDKLNILIHFDVLLIDFYLILI